MNEGGDVLKLFLKITLSILGVILIGIGILVVVFLLEMKPDKDKEEKVRIQAEQYLKEHNIDIENLTRNNFRDFIPVEYIEREKKEMLKITEEKNSKKDFIRTRFIFLSRR